MASMMSISIARPHDVLQLGVFEVGGKAFGLAKLEQIGVRVPAWFVLTRTCLDHHLKNANLESTFQHILLPLNQLDPQAPQTRVQLDQAAEKMQSLLARTKFDQKLAQELEKSLLYLGPGPYAVRSSMAGEDSVSHSFAGQLESFLFRQDTSDVIQAIQQSWASAFSSRVLFYRLQAGQRLDLPQVGVVVQCMLSGQVSGVVFTAHPLSGRRDHQLVTAAWGQGEGVVSGTCNADEYVVDHEGREISYTIADKDVALVADPSGKAGLVQQVVLPEQRKTRCLSVAQLARLSQQTVKVAHSFGQPMDIEWTLADDRFYLLQARPITSLPVPQNVDGPRVVFDNSNIQESYCGVTTPLTFSFASAAYASVYQQTMIAGNIDPKVIQQFQPLLRNLLGLVRGRVYYNINNWYRGLLLLPSFGKNKADMEAMMGLVDPVDLVQDQVLSLGQKLRKLPRMLNLLVRLLRKFRRLKRSVPAFLQEFQRVYQKVDRLKLKQASFSELMATKELLDRELLGNWHIPIVNDFWVMMASGSLRRMVSKATMEEPNLMISNLLAGEEGIESTEPTRQLMFLAREASRSAVLTQMLQQQDAPALVFARIQAEHRDYARKLNDYIERYGDRVMGELKLETKTLRDDPSFLISVLQNYLTRPDLDPDRLLQQEKQMRSAAETQLRENLHLWGRMRMKRVLRAARMAVKFRENMRLARTRLFGLYRDVFCSLGQRLFEVGRLEQPRDVFYLTMDEIQAYHEGRAVTTDLGGLARLRKREFAQYEKQDMPHHFITIGPVYHGNRFEYPYADKTPTDPVAKVLKGTGCYPGVVEGPVRVIMSPQDELSLNGRILVTVRTDPGWAPLFPTCQGILVQRGSALSHSAVVARELGIPAIVGIPDLVNLLRDGERVRMDGGLGTIERLQGEVAVPAQPQAGSEQVVRA